MRTFVLILIFLGCLGGYWYVTHHQKEVSDALTQATDAKNATVDGAVTAGMQSVAKVSPAYYLQEGRSYGISAEKNICVDSTSNVSLGAIISGIQKYTKAVSCIADPDFPSRSFTITAPSLVNAGQYYCTDQIGFAGLIQSIDEGSTFRSGIKCK